MAEQNFPDNVFYEMDNINVLRGMNSETIDLIVTDPPFNTRRKQDGSAGFYADNWKWGIGNSANEVDPNHLNTIRKLNSNLYDIITISDKMHGKEMSAYLCFLAIRIIEMRRVLKLTGSIYLHCDQTANAYIRLCLDAIFSSTNFKNEIVWAYRTGGASRKHWSRKHDNILFYSKSNLYQHQPLKERRVYDKGFFTTQTDELGQPYSDVYIRDVWDDLKPLIHFSNERTGYPSQKPLKLYERVISASSSKNDIVLDPFSGSGAACVAANNLNRRFIGIDRNPDARLSLMSKLVGEANTEMEATFPLKEWIEQQSELRESRYLSESVPIRTDNRRYP